MKKSTVLLGLALSGVLLSTGTLQASAATEKSTTTEGKVIFKTQGDDSEGEVTKPDTDEEIITPETGGNTKGPLRFNQVPNFDFDTVEIRSETRANSALIDKYTKEGSTDKNDISHFVQVEDVRGEKADWSVSVASSKFIPSVNTNPTLDKTHIEFTQGKLFNTRMSDAEIATSVTKYDTKLVVGNDNAAVKLMETAAGKDTDSSKTSLVFNNSYTEANPAAGSETKDGKVYNPGVKLNTIGSDEKVKGETYTATLTWTLTSAL